MLKYITSNKDKIASARMNLLPFGLDFQEQEVDLLEMQSASITEIAESKAKQAFEIIQEPLFVSDHGWTISALRGFPGPYMKYMNNWLTSEDF